MSKKLQTISHSKNRNAFSNTNNLPVRWRRTTRKNPCPICSKPDWCEITDDGALAHCMRVPSSRPAQHRMGGWYHDLLPRTGLSAADLRPKSKPAAALPGAENETLQPLSITELNEVNSAFLSLCPLSTEHRSYLEGEGLSQEDLARCGSLVGRQAYKIARELIRRFGEATAKRHPLLKKVYSEDGRSWWSIAGATTGILFPAVDLEGRILGIQVRRDHLQSVSGVESGEITENKVKTEDESRRYWWLSSEGKGGTPLTIFRAGPGAASEHHVIITEGFKKAAVAARAWQCHAISLAGVHSYKDSELVNVIEGLKVKSISLAFDQDKRLKPTVHEAEQRLLRLLSALFPELDLYYLNWEEGFGKGLDDALKTGANFNFEPATNQGPRLATDLPAKAVSRTFGKSPSFFTLAEARQLHRAFFDRLVNGIKPDGSQTIITSSTGTGKSAAGDDALAEAVLSGMLNGRWLLLAPNKENIAERTSPTTKLGQALAAGLVAIQRGRHLIDLSRPRTPQAEDCANPLAQDAGAARQAAASVVCADCPFGSEENWLKYNELAGINSPGPQPFKCKEEGYLHSRLVSEKAQVVIATKEAYLNNSDMIGKFDGIICDEELVPYLIEIITISTNVMAGWREKIALRSLNAPEWEKLFKIIETALDNLARERQTQVAGTNSAPIKTTSGFGQFRLVKGQERLEDVANSLGYDIYQVIEECEDYPHLNQEGIYDFEQHYKHNATLRIPFRAGRELLEALQNQDNPPRFGPNPDGSFSLILHIPRQKLIRLLDSKTLVVLDATMPPVLKMLLPKLVEVSYPVPQNLHITQITNALYSKQDLYREATRKSLEEAIATFTAVGSRRKVLTVLPLRFEEGKEAIKVPEGSQVEHWGLHRATSKYSGCETLVLLGHHIRPIDYIRAEVEAARAFAGLGDFGPENPKLQKIRLYNHVLPNDQAVGRWMKADEDADVQAAIENDYVTNIVQAIGRLRAALRPSGVAPARVLILCNEPVGQLRVDQLTTVSELRNKPPKRAIFINNNYMKRAGKGVIVPYFTAVMEGKNPWDEALIQDETPQTQCLDFDEWEWANLPDNFPQLE